MRHRNRDYDRRRKGWYDYQSFQNVAPAPYNEWDRVTDAGVAREIVELREEIAEIGLRIGEIRGELERRFKALHDLCDDDFATDHWQTLFTIQHPEAR